MKKTKLMIFLKRIYGVFMIPIFPIILVVDKLFICPKLKIRTTFQESIEAVIDAWLKAFWEESK